MNKHLLFAALAVQKSFVSPENLVAGLDAWLRQPERPLPEVLRELGRLDPGQVRVLDDFVDSYSTQREAPRRGSLPSTIAASAESLPETGAFFGEETSPESGAPTGRYAVLRPHARGGLGQVFVARDQELGREVALKEIQPRYADRPEARERFVREAKVTGGLEHPGVVPVYGLGVYPDGRPYYAMRLIQGETLHSAITRTHADGRAKELRPLLTRFVTVCQAVAYAHSKGVVHRDLKPANVMLGPFGETLVVDWGLAKELNSETGRHGDAEKEAAATADPLTLSGPDEAHTRQGQALGTPAYMSPEQAAGRQADVGAASDVYGLGATFYHILTGRSPFDGVDPADVLRRVQTGEWLPPKQICPAVPPALDAVCRRAMALRPENRYGSALDLAADVEAWLADEPVRAWREPWAVRAGRWVRRHRAGVFAGVAAVAVAAICLGATSGFLLAAYRDADEQRGLAAQQRDRAEGRFRLARRAVDEFHNQVADSRELKAQGLESLREKLLRRATAFYEELVRESGDDPATLAEHGRAYLRLAELARQLNDTAQAEAAFAQASGVFDRLAAERPVDAGLRFEQVRTAINLGHYLYDQSRLDGAERAFAEACDLCESLVSAAPAEEEYQVMLGNCYNNLGALFNDRNQNAEAEAAHLRALAIRQRLAGAHPEKVSLQSAVAISHNNLANVYRSTGRFDAAVAAQLQARDIKEELARRNPDVPSYQHSLFKTLYNLASIYQDQGKTEAARGTFEQARAVIGRLAEAHPRVVEYRYDQGGTESDLGSRYQELGLLKEAEQAFRKGQAVLEALVKEYPQTPNLRFDLANLRGNVSALYAHDGRWRQASEELAEATKLYETLVREVPNEAVEYATGLAKAYNERGQFELNVGRPREALAWLDRAAQKAQEVLKKDERQSRARLVLHNTLVDRALAHDRLGEAAAAAEALDQAATLNPRGEPYLLARAVVQARAGMATAVEAAATAKEKSLPGYTLCDVARVYALAMRTDTAHAQAHAAEAMTCLRRAKDLGYFREEATRTLVRDDPDLAALRGRPEFEALFSQP